MQVPTMIPPLRLIPAALTARGQNHQYSKIVLAILIDGVASSSYKGQFLLFKGALDVTGDYTAYTHVHAPLRAHHSCRRG